MTGPPPPDWAVDPEAAAAIPCADGVWRLRLPLPWPTIDHVNAYAVARRDGLMLVDCGSGGDPSCELALEAALASAGHELSEVRALVITHAHSDHAGLASFVRRRSGCEVLIHPDNAHFYAPFHEPQRVSAARLRRARQEAVPDELLGACADLREEIEAAEPIAGAAPLRGGDRLPSSVGEWEVIETPGHAPSHVCLLQRDSGLAIVGDIVCRVFVPWFDYGCSHDPIAEYLDSLHALEEALPELALPGHGRPLADVAGTIEEHRESLASRLAAVRETLRVPARGAYEVALRIFGEQPDAIATVERLTETSGYLRHLRLRGEAARELGPDRVFRHSAPGS